MTPVADTRIYIHDYLVEIRVDRGIAFDTFCFASCLWILACGIWLAMISRPLGRNVIKLIDADDTIQIWW